MVFSRRAMIPFGIGALAAAHRGRQGINLVPQATPASPCLGGRAIRWGLIGNDGTRLHEERAAGIEVKLFSLSWRHYVPQENVTDDAYVASKRDELAALCHAEFAVILSLGYHDVPAWIHATSPDSYYVNQYGDRYSRARDNGSINLVFNPTMRALTASYIAQVFTDFRHDFAGVRVGGGRYGELSYPPSVAGRRTNCYWAFDAAALSRSPVPDWAPGRPSPRAEATRFLEWYLDALTAFQTWQIATVRRWYGGPIMVLYPSWGIRNGDVAAAAEGALDGTTSAEQNGEIQRGHDVARHVRALTDPNAVVTTTWLEVEGDDDDPSSQRWSPVKYLTSLAAAHPLRLRTYGENAGWDDAEAMARSVAQMDRYGLAGMLWFREDQLFSGAYATLDDYRRLITAADRSRATDGGSGSASSSR